MSDQSPDGGVSSAVPEHLIAYSRAALQIDEQIHELALRLGKVLEAYRATNPEFGAPIPRIEDDILRYARHCRSIDERVGRIGAAFERAGSGEGHGTGAPPGQPVHTDESALESALSAAEGAAATALHGLASVGGGILHLLGGAVSDVGEAEEDFIGAFGAGARDLAGAVDGLVDGITTERIGRRAVADTSEARVRDALEVFHQLLEAGSFLGGDRSDLESIDQRLRDLSPDDLNLFLASLSDGDLQEWNRRISDTGGFLTHRQGLGDDDRTELSAILLRWASPDQLARVQRAMPFLQPDFSVKDGHPTGWLSGSALPLFAPGRALVDPEKDINQGQDGDCWFLSSLGAIAERNPGLLARNIRANDNGTYTVTFYRDGHPVEITVTDDYPKGDHGWDGYVYAHTASGSGKWPLVYEKAYAEFKGAYGSIDGGHEKDALGDLTGGSVESGGAGGHSLAEINNRIAQGYAVTSSSERKWPWQGDTDDSPGGTVVRQHAYYVKSVNMGAHPPTITLVNPWGGSDTSAPQYVTLTEQQWHDYFSDVSYTKVGG